MRRWRRACDSPCSPSSAARSCVARKSRRSTHLPRSSWSSSSRLSSASPPECPVAREAFRARPAPLRRGCWPSHHRPGSQAAAPRARRRVRVRAARGHHLRSQVTGCHRLDGLEGRFVVRGVRARMSAYVTLTTVPGSARLPLRVPARRGAGPGGRGVGTLGPPSPNARHVKRQVWVVGTPPPTEAPTLWVYYTIDGWHVTLRMLHIVPTADL